ncbi:MAG: hypothetical protein ACM3US_04275 [Sphingomonadaceae bacterium]
MEMVRFSWVISSGEILTLALPGAAVALGASVADSLFEVGLAPSPDGDGCDDCPVSTSGEFDCWFSDPPPAAHAVSTAETANSAIVLAILGLTATSIMTPYRYDRCRNN